MVKCRKVIGFCVGLLLFNGVAEASAYQSVEQLRMTAKAYLLTALKQENPAFTGEVSVGNIDSRLHLTECEPDKLTIYSPYGRPFSRVGSLGVKCSAPQRWSLYIPVKIKQLLDVVVARHHLRRGGVIRREDLQMRTQDVKRLRYGYFTATKQVVGMVAKQSIRVNQAVTPNRIARAKLIKKGDAVTITAKGRALRVTVKGIALATGRRGDVIPVKNLTSKRTIDARVTARQRVEVKL